MFEDMGGIKKKQHASEPLEGWIIPEDYLKLFLTHSHMSVLRLKQRTKDLGILKMEGVVLVDDQRANFQHFGSNHFVWQSEHAGN